MVKLNWLEECVIYIIIAGIMIFLINKFFSYDYSWLGLIIWFILYLVISSIVIKIIKGKDAEKEEKDERLKNWWKEQKTWKKVTIILSFIIICLAIGYSIQVKEENGDVDLFDKDKFVKEMLEEDGYEVINNHYLDIGNESWAFVQMKSLGNRNNQVWDSLITLGVYKNATHYIIDILAPTEECIYSIDGNIYRAYLRATNGEKVLSVNGTELNGATLYDYINYEIETSEKCS